MSATLIIIFICSYLAFSLSAICGGGAGLMLIPVLGRFLPVTQVPAALSIGTFTSSASRVFFFFARIRWDIVKWFVPAALPAVWLGAWLLKFINPLYLELAMGLFLISNLFFLFKKSSGGMATGSTSKVGLTVIGFLAGFLSGLTGAVGLLFNKFYFQYGLTKEEIVATRAANELLLHLVKIILYSLFGLISTKVLSAGLVVAVAALLSSWSMKWILPKLNDGLFRKLGYAAMVVSGIMLLGQSGNTILVEHKGNLSFDLISEGVETKLKWQKANFSMEFTYDSGFEFEQVIPYNELDKKRQEFVTAQRENADKIVIEVAYGIGKESYEAYYFNQNRLFKTIEFD